ncbi:MAG: hypothetical protein ABSC55_04835, partial [Syntrophorhabdales bacterium]
SSIPCTHILQRKRVPYKSPTQMPFFGNYLNASRSFFQSVLKVWRGAFQAMKKPENNSADK